MPLLPLPQPQPLGAGLKLNKIFTVHDRITGTHSNGSSIFHPITRPFGENVKRVVSLAISGPTL